MLYDIPTLEPWASLLKDIWVAPDTVIEHIVEVIAVATIKIGATHDTTLP